MVRRFVRNRAADMLAVERPPDAMNADEARLLAAVEFAFAAALAERVRNSA